MIGAVEESAHFYESFPDPAGSSSLYATENTLYIALLVARAWHENPARFDRLLEIQAQTSREREWGYRFSSDDLREAALGAVRSHFESLGSQSMTKMANGYDLEATMMRRGIPFEIDSDTKLESDWLQVCQRISKR